MRLRFEPVMVPDRMFAGECQLPPLHKDFGSFLVELHTELALDNSLLYFIYVKGAQS